jgi:hypothetical protein
MALVMTGVGLAIVFARDRLEQLNRESTLARVTSVAPLGAAVLVLGFGVYLTAVAVGASPAL